MEVKYDIITCKIINIDLERLATIDDPWIAWTETSSRECVEIDSTEFLYLDWFYWTSKLNCNTQIQKNGSYSILSKANFKKEKIERKKAGAGVEPGACA